MSSATADLAGLLLRAPLDRRRVVQVIVSFLVPRLADSAYVDLVQPDGSTERPAVAHADGLRDLLERPDRWEIVVPLRARGRTLGKMVLARRGSAARYDDRDSATVRALAEQCALAIDKAAIHREARDAKRRLGALLDSMEDASVVLLDPQGRVVSQNCGAERLWGYATKEIVGQPVSRFYPESDVVRGRAERALRKAELEGRDEQETRQVRKDGSAFFAHVMLARLCDEAGELLGFSSVVRDITERKELEGLLTHQAMHDDLTGLPNRALLLDRMTLALARSERHAGAPAVLFVDLDGFKLVNDSLGHNAGDELLVTVARRLEQCVRPEDTVARVGGDEFAVLCEGLPGIEAATPIAERITRDVAAPIQLRGQEVVVQASTGIVIDGGADATPDGLLHDADTAMYRAKQSGRGRHRVFEEEMRPRALERLTTERELRRALDEHRLRVHYQPVVDVRTGRLVGAEALVRWAHPDRGLLAPSEFIELAEETGLIQPIGAFVLETACAQAMRWSEQWPDRPAPAILVNLSARQVGRPELPELIERALARTGLDPPRLCLEITEGVLMGNALSSVRSMAALKDLGVRLAIDDFGTGYSSLSYLERFPVDYLKVDRSFVKSLKRDGAGSPLVAAMTSLALALGLTVIAEGVETVEQLTELERLGCELAQGFYLARPQSAETLDDLLREGSGQLATVLPARGRFRRRERGEV